MSSPQTRHQLHLAKLGRLADVLDEDYPDFAEGFRTNRKIIHVSASRALSEAEKASAEVRAAHPGNHGPTRKHTNAQPGSSRPSFERRVRYLRKAGYGFPFRLSARDPTPPKCLHLCGFLGKCPVRQFAVLCRTLPITSYGSYDLCC